MDITILKTFDFITNLYPIKSNIVPFHKITTELKKSYAIGNVVRGYCGKKRTFNVL